MRILVAHAYYRLRGGEDRYVDEQVQLLGKNHSVRLHAVQNSGLSPARATGAMFGSLSVRRSFDDAVSSFKPDVIHLHNAHPALGPIPNLGAKKHGIPLVMTIHNYRLRCPNGLTFTEGRLCERCVGGNHANAVLHRCFESRAQAASYAAALWIQRFVLHTESRVSLFVTPSDFVRNQLQEWGIGPTRTVRSFTRPFPEADATPGLFGMYVGRLSAEKGLAVLLRALHKAGDPPFKVVGEGPGEVELLALSESLGLKRTKFTGRLDTPVLDDFLRRARYVVLPSLWNETGGLAVMEGMAAGRPILVSDRGGLPELVAESGGGYVAKAEQVGDLAEKLRKFDSDELCREMGSKALEYARQHLSREAHLAAMDGIYEEVLALRP